MVRKVTVTRIATYEFVKTVLREANAPFDTTFSLGKYMLIVGGNDICEILLKEDPRYDKTGDYGSTVIFSIKDYEVKST